MPELGRVEGWDEMNPYIKCLWIARMLADHAWCTIIVANEMKWMRWVWRDGDRRKWEKPQEKTYPDSDLPTKKHTWSDCDANSETQRCEASN